jgi:hypothetical protein
MSTVLDRIYGSLLIVRPPVPVTLNKAGANYKSEVTHVDYSPRGAYDEWLAICEGILAFGGDAILDFEAEDDPYLDKGPLAIDAQGKIHPAGSTEVLGAIDDIDTGRVFAANGPWVTVGDGEITALMPNMLAHRTREWAYYQSLLEKIAESTHLELSALKNPHRWEGMADVAAVGDRVVFTYTVEGHYDEGQPQKTMRSSRKGVEFAAEFAEIDKDACIYAELVYPHFHGDTVHFGARPKAGSPVLVHYPGGLWRNDGSKVIRGLGEDRIVTIDRTDAVEKYAGNSRQVNGGVLVPDGVSEAFIGSLESLGLETRRVPLFELFGKAGGGPACATLYLPTNLEIPKESPLRFSVRRAETRARRERIAESLVVDPELFKGRARG